MVFILKNLAIGDFQDANEAKEKDFAFLNVAEELNLELPERALYHKIPVKDFIPIPVEQLSEATDWIRKQIGKRRVLVFCSAGVGRSSSVVIGYLCAVKRFGFGKAVEYVAQKKADISILPNLIKTIQEITSPRRSRGSQ